MNDASLRTPRLLLAPPVSRVTPAEVCAAMGDFETARYLSSVPWPYTEESAASFLSFLAAVGRDADNLHLGVFLEPSLEFIGMVSLEGIDGSARSAELGYWLSKSRWGVGYGREAADALLGHAVEALGIVHFRAFVMVENARSRSLLSSLGFKERERLPNDAENKGKLVDRLRYELVLGSR